jgi:hypothetical protein
VTYTAWETRPLYAAITDQLETTGKAVGQAISPGGELPYMVIYPLPDQGTDGTLGDPHQMAAQLFQVTAVGDTMEEAQWMQHKAREALLGWAPTVAGTSVARILLDMGSGVSRDPDGPTFFTTDRFQAITSV